MATNVTTGPVDAQTGTLVGRTLQRTDGRFRRRGVGKTPGELGPSVLAGHAGLRLITCGGTFDRSTGHYRSNVVVHARLAGQYG
jgi:hypothetical protein